MADGIIEFEISGSPWRANQGSQLTSFFGLDAETLPKFGLWASTRSDLGVPWTIVRLFFGIEPLIQDENADPDIYGGSKSIDEIAEMRKCDAEEVKMEL